MRRPSLKRQEGRPRPNVILRAAPCPGRGNAVDPRLAPLKTRPLEILLCFLAGDPDREIAARLHISPSTVRRNLSAVLSAFGVADRQALRRAYACRPEPLAPGPKRPE